MTSKEDFNAAKFNPDDPVFEKQRGYVNSILEEDIQNLVRLFDRLKKDGDENELYDRESFKQLHKKLYDLHLIFDYRWMEWHTGW